MKTDTADDIGAFFPSEVTVEVAGETFVLKAWPARHLRPYININRRMSAKAAALGSELGREYAEAKAAAEAAGQPPLPPLDLDKIPVELLHERCYEEYLELVATATGKPTAWVEELGIDELVTMAGIINELNEQRYSKKPFAPTVRATSRG